MANRLLIVTNRLPVSVQRDEDDFTLRESSGGLATGLRGVHAAEDTIWIGWSGIGERLSRSARQRLDADFAERRLVAVHLSKQEVRQYYEGFSNGVIWPLFHYLLDRMPLQAPTWSVYQAVNEKIADAAARQYRPGDTFWVHDYQLMLVPTLLRQRVPDARIGFFLHIPFPSAEIVRLLPWREDLLRGLLGADLIGFHTPGFVRHFETSVRLLIGLQPLHDELQWDGRRVKVGCHPMGIDAAEFDRLAGRPDVEAEVARIRAEVGRRSLLLGVDRLDYTKGIPRRLLAFGELLASDPSWRERVRLVQIASPSRDRLEPYQAFRRQVEEIVSSVNGRFGTVDGAPIHYLYQNLTREELVALYRAADVMLVTPLRDGMNLVAKEYVASRIDGDGCLVLSEFAGAAAEMGEALIVNPYDVPATAQAIRRALDMDPAERRVRMRALRQRVQRNTVQRWAEEFLGDLMGDDGPARDGTFLWSPGSDMRRLVERLSRLDRLNLLLDYDGTLVPFASTPELAAPGAGVVELITRLAGQPGWRVHVVSGRPRASLDAWLEPTPAVLWAEHGYWHRRAPGLEWASTVDVNREWMTAVRAVMTRFADRSPGAMLEEKTASLAWHYRMLDRELAATRLVQIRQALAPLVASEQLEMLEGNCVLEVRHPVVNKGRVVQEIVRQEPDVPVLAVGDDRTDEDMFAAVPPGGVTVRIGAGVTTAAYRLRDPEALFEILQELLAAARALHREERRP
ncbi:MAG: bifunctional alpha,alpha-trehalose-phosphate synthase (UDP-forming)/trehalose-phosphatase [Acidobacteriota bacterium]